MGNTIQGALAEYLVVDQHALIEAPGYLSDEEAASLACAGLTAWYSLVEKGQLKADQTVLVQGTGGVSIFGLQIASALGTRVESFSSDFPIFALLLKQVVLRGVSVGPGLTIAQIRNFISSN